MLGEFGLNNEHIAPDRRIAILDLDISKAIMDSGCSPMSRIKYCLRDYSQNPIAKRVIESLESPRKYAFRTCYRTKRDPLVPFYLNMNGIEFPLEGLVEGKLFMDIGGYTIAEDYLLPKPLPEAYYSRSFGPVEPRCAIESWIMIYRR